MESKELTMGRGRGAAGGRGACRWVNAFG